MLQEESIALELNILLFRGNENWIAQGLEYDIGAQGKTIDDALYELQRLIIGHVAIRQELDLPPLQEAIPKAPEMYWRQFEKAKRLETELPPMTVEKEPPIIPREEPRPHFPIAGNHSVPVTTSGEFRIAA